MLLKWIVLTLPANPQSGGGKPVQQNCPPNCPLTATCCALHPGYLMSNGPHLLSTGSYLPSVPVPAAHWSIPPA